MNPPTPNWSIARQLAAASGRAYREATLSDPRTDTQLLIEQTGKVIVVAFRGSSSVRDFIVDAQFGKEDLTWDVDDYTAEVHRGFLEAYESVSVALVAWLRSNLTEANQIYLTGHSLGGALAVLAALDLHRLNIPVTGVYTFGQPRVGNKAFAVAYNEVLGGITFCLVNQGDPVPLLPPLLNGYRDCGVEVFLRDDGAIQFDPFIGVELVTDVLGALVSWRSGRLGLLPNHFLARYQSKISLL